MCDMTTGLSAHGGRGMEKEEQLIRQGSLVGFLCHQFSLMTIHRRRVRGWARIGRREEGTSSFRAELAALLMLLREAPADDTRVARIWTHVGETDSESERVRLTVERPRQTDRQTAGRARERDDEEKDKRRISAERHVHTRQLRRPLSLARSHRSRYAKADRVREHNRVVLVGRSPVSQAPRLGSSHRRRRHGGGGVI